MLLRLSFCDTQRPKGEQFLGVAIVAVPHLFEDDEGSAVKFAIRETHRLGINPGGEVLTFEVPPEGEQLARQHVHRLMERAELETIFGEGAPMADLGEWRRSARHV